MKRVILFTIITAIFALFTFSSKTERAKAESEIPQDLIEELFVEVGAELGYYDFELDSWQPGNKQNELCKYDENGMLIRSGFKPVVEGQNLSGKTVYVYETGHQNRIIHFTIENAIDNNTYYLYVEAGEVTLRDVRSVTASKGQRLVNNLHKIIMPASAGKVIHFSQMGYEPGAFACLYTFEQAPVIEQQITESEEETSISSWFNQNEDVVIICAVLIGLFIVALAVAKK